MTQKGLYKTAAKYPLPRAYFFVGDQMIPDLIVMWVGDNLQISREYTGQEEESLYTFLTEALRTHILRVVVATESSSEGSPIKLKGWTIEDFPHVRDKGLECFTSNESNYYKEMVHLVAPMVYPIMEGDTMLSAIKDAIMRQFEAEHMVRAKTVHDHPEVNRKFLSEATADPLQSVINDLRARGLERVLQTYNETQHTTPFEELLENIIQIMPELHFLRSEVHNHADLAIAMGGIQRINDS